MPWSLLPLLRANLLRNKTRTVLTLLSVTTALFLFGLLAKVDLAFRQAKEAAGRAERLIVTNRTSPIVPLLRSQLGKIERIPGVVSASHATWFGGVYREPRNFFPQLAVEPEYLALYPEIVLSHPEREAFASDLQGCVVGRKTADRFGFRIGDRIPLKDSPFPKPGGGAWELTVRGIYDGRRPIDDTSVLFLHSRLLDETVPSWRGRAIWFVVRVEDAARAAEVARAIDGRFANSPNETRSQPEDVWVSSWIQDVGNVRLLAVVIGAVVLFTLLLVTGSTMAVAVRERTAEIAVLKTIGFADRTIVLLVLAESLSLTLVGGGVGLMLAARVPNPLPGILSVFHLGPGRLVQGLVLSVLVGFLAGISPAASAMRLRIVTGLRRI